MDINYKLALIKYFSRLSNTEKIIKCGSTDLGIFLHKYMKNAIYDTDCILTMRIQKLLRKHNAYVILNKDIEYNFPHTLDNLIIVFEPPTYKLIIHELTHIYFRRNPMCNIVVSFCRANNIVILKRNKLDREITNPDTYYFTGLYYARRIIFIALMHSGTTYRPLYLTYIGGQIRRATTKEITYYNNILPYGQNYHPEEILAEIISANI